MKLLNDESTPGLIKEDLKSGRSMIGYCIFFLRLSKYIIPSTQMRISHLPERDTSECATQVAMVSRRRSILSQMSSPQFLVTHSPDKNLSEFMRNIPLVETKPPWCMDTWLQGPLLLV